MSDYSHFSLTRDDDNVAWLKIDVAGKSVNVMASDVMVELSAITRELAENPPSGLVFYSGKERGFVFG
ncbi:MAG: enoyl-CoA hydratase, partial [Candidatus Puniceispirillum sp.]